MHCGFLWLLGRFFFPFFEVCLTRKGGFGTERVLCYFPFVYVTCKLSQSFKFVLRLGRPFLSSPLGGVGCSQEHCGRSGQRFMDTRLCPWQWQVGWGRWDRGPTLSSPGWPSGGHQCPSGRLQGPLFPAPQWELLSPHFPEEGLVVWPQDAFLRACRRAALNPTGCPARVGQRLEPGSP